MREIDRIQDQLQRAFQGDAWHGASLMELLADVDAKRAAAKPLARAHSIWEITLHIAAWEDVARRRTLGEAVELTDEQDWPPVRDTSEAAWGAALARLRNGHEELRRTLAGLDDAKLIDGVPGRDYTVYVLLHGVIQHDLYHAGQIALLMKA